MQRSKTSNTSIDKLAKNLINAKLLNKSLNDTNNIINNINNNITKSNNNNNDIKSATMPHQNRRKANLSSKLMSSMNEDFQDTASSLLKATNDMPLGSLVSAGNLKNSPPSSPQSAAAAAAAAVQALLAERNSNGNANTNGLYSAASLAAAINGKNDVNKNFKQDTNSSQFNQQQLLLQQYNLNSLLGNNNGNTGTGLNHLLLQQAGIDTSVLSGLINSLGKQQQQQQQNVNNSKLNTNNGRLNSANICANDDDAVMAAAMLAASANGTPGLNIGLIKQHNQQQRQARRNGDLIKGNSMSPSPRGTSCSEETETQHSSSGSPLSSTHDVMNGAGCSSGASASGSDTSNKQNRRRRSNANPSKNLSASGKFKPSDLDGVDMMNGGGDLDQDDLDGEEDSRSSPHGSHSPNSSSLTHNDLLANVNNNGDCDNSMMDNLDDEDLDDEHTANHNNNEDHLDDLDESDLNYSTTNNSQTIGNNTSQQPRRNRKSGGKASTSSNRTNSTSSPTRSSSSQAQSRSVSPSMYQDSAALSSLAAVAAANGIDSATAMLAAQSLLQSSTPGLGFPGLTGNLPSAGAAAGLATPSGAGANNSNQASTRKRRNDRESISERNKKIKPVPDDKKDDAYWERRRKNNEAAKRSRDLRRQKEDEIAVRASFLEQENLKLKAQVTILKAELSKLHFMLYNR